jgi:hypothetical protein
VNPVPNLNVAVDSTLLVEDNSAARSLNVEDFATTRTGAATETTLQLVRQALTPLAAFVDGLETLLAALGASTDQVESLLTDIKGYTDGLESALTTLANQVLTDNQLRAAPVAVTTTNPPADPETGLATEATLDAVRTAVLDLAADDDASARDLTVAAVTTAVNAAEAARNSDADALKARADLLASDATLGLVLTELAAKLETGGLVTAQTAFAPAFDDLEFVPNADAPTSIVLRLAGVVVATKTVTYADGAIARLAPA